MIKQSSINKSINLQASKQAFLVLKTHNFYELKVCSKYVQANER